MYESRAIARYLVKQYGGESTLIPKEAHANALFEQGGSIEVSHFSPFAAQIVREKIYAPCVSLLSSCALVCTC